MLPDAHNSRRNGPRSSKNNFHTPSMAGNICAVSDHSSNDILSSDHHSFMSKRHQGYMGLICTKAGDARILRMRLELPDSPGCGRWPSQWACLHGKMTCVTPLAKRTRLAFEHELHQRTLCSRSKCCMYVWLCFGEMVSRSHQERRDRATAQVLKEA